VFTQEQVENFTRYGVILDKLLQPLLHLVSELNETVKPTKRIRISFETNFFAHSLFKHLAIFQNSTTSTTSTKKQKSCKRFIQAHNLKPSVTAAANDMHNFLHQACASLMYRASRGGEDVELVQQMAEAR
jgi:hypothetical protein